MPGKSPAALARITEENKRKKKGSNDSSDSDSDTDSSPDSDSSLSSEDPLNRQEEVPESQHGAWDGVLSGLPRWEGDGAPAEPEDEAEAASAVPRTYTRDDIPQFVAQKERVIHVRMLTWDEQCTLGQIRKLSKKMQDHYLRQLKLNPPRSLIKVLVRACPGMSEPLPRIAANLI